MQAGFVKGIKKSNWRNLISAEATRFFAHVALPPVVLAIATNFAVNAAFDLRQTPVEVQTKATQLWRENGYEVTGFKSYNRGRIERSVTLTLKKNADGKAYEGTATCTRTCSVSHIAKV